MNKIITFLVVGLYLFAFNPLAKAQTLPTFRFSPECVTPNAGEPFTVNMEVTDFQNLIGFQYLITFDESVIKPVFTPSSQNPENGTVIFSDINTDLIIVNGGYVSGQGIRISWNSLTGTPVTVPSSIGTFTQAFTIPFNVIGNDGDATQINIDCTNFDCEIIGQNPTTGDSEPIASSINYEQGIVDVGAANNCMTDNGGSSNGGSGGGGNGGGGSGGTTDPLTVNAGNPSGPTGSVLCMPVTVADFNDLVGVQYSIHFDETLFQYHSTQNYNLTDLTSGNFGTSQVNNGILTFSWNVQSNGGAGVTVDNGTAIYEVCFTVLGAGGTSSPFTFDGIPTEIEVVAEGMTPTDQINFTNGTLNATGDGGGVNSVTLTAEDVSADPNTNVCIPVTAESFDNIVGFQYSMNWDPALLTYTGSQNYHPSLLAFTASSLNNSEPGELRVSWNHPSNTAIDIPDGETLYEICFDVVGDAGSTPSVVFSDMPLPIEIISPTGPDGLLNSNDATVTITNEGGFNINPAVLNGCPDDAPICVPFIVSGFNEVLGTQWTIEYDDTVLDYNGSIQNIPSNIIALVSGSFNETTSGMIRFSWSDPIGTGATLPDGSTFFEMCFDLVGNTDDSSDISITDNLTPQEVTAFVDGVASVIPSAAGKGNITISCEPLGEPINIDTDASTTSDSNCGGDGTIDVVFTGGTAPFTFAWTPNVGDTEDLSGIDAGDYTLTITDNTNATATATFTVAGNDPLTATTNSTNESANAAGDGTIDLTVNGGTTPYTFEWSNNATTEDIDNLNPSNYTVTVTDANDCTTTATGIVGTALTIGSPSSPGGPNGSTIISNISCNGNTDGEIDLVFTGGIAPYTFNWDTTPATNEDLSELAVGTYCVTVTDFNQNSATACFDITEPDPITITLDDTQNTTQQGATNGAIYTTVTGGTAPYNFTWIPGGGGPNTTEDLENISAGTYQFIVVDANGCSTQSDTYIVEDGDPTPSVDIVNSTIVDVACFGECTGSIDAVVVGGQAPYTLEWSQAGFGNTTNIDGLCAGIHTVTITDANQLVGISNIEIVELSNAALTSTGSVTHESAVNANDGAILVMPAGGTTPYTYAWSDGNATTAERTDLAPDTYTVTVTDANNCTVVDEFTVDPAQVRIDVAGSLIASDPCFGSCMGGINVALSGGAAPFTFAWSPNTDDVTQNVSELCAGIYTVTVTDANGTTDSASFTVFQPDAPLNITGTVTNVVDSEDGAIDITVTGGTGILTYAWSNGESSQDITGLSAGDYTVTVMDSNNCEEIMAFTVAPNLYIDMQNSMVTNATCFGGNNGSIDAVIQGGAAPLTYNWSSGQNTQDITGLSAGTHVLTVTDAAGNSDSQSFVVGQGTEIISDIVTTAESTNGCDGSATVTETEGGIAPYTYEWFDTQGNFLGAGQTIVNVCAGGITLVTTDALGCTNSTNANINTDFGVRAAEVQHVDCFGESTGAIDITTVGGNPPYTWSWVRNGSIPTGIITEDINNQPAGLYTVNIQDNDGQQFSMTYTIMEPDAPLEISNVVITDAIAPNLGAIDITVTGGTPPYSYSWSNGATSEDINNLEEGCYRVTIKDANDCILISPDYCVEYEPTPISINGAMASQPTCHGDINGTILLNIDGGDPNYTICWTSSNCSTITSQPPFDHTINGLAAGTYTITITDFNGQMETREVTVTEPDAITIDPLVTNITDCPGNGAIQLNAAGGVPPLSFSWEGPGGFGGSTSPNLVDLSIDGDYYVTVTDGNDCTFFSDAIEVEMETEPISIQLAGSSVMNVTCANSTDGSIGINVTGGFCPESYTYQWSANAGGADTPNISSLGAGEYTVTVTDEAMQSATQTFTIESESDLEIVSAFVTTGPSAFMACDAQASIVVNSSNGVNITWCNNQVGPNANSLCPGECEIIVTDNLGCETSTVLVITDLPTPMDTLIVNPIPEAACGEECDGTITLDIIVGSAPFNYAWNPNIGNSGFIDGLCAGDYAYTVTDNNGEIAMGSVSVAPSDLVLSFETDEPTNLATADGAIEVSVQGGSGNYTYQWNVTDGTTNRIENLRTGTYWVVVIDEDSGCEITGNVELGSEGDCLTARNIITPNEDGCNDEFVIYCIGQCESNTLEIYNRWGQLVMEYENYTNEWIGQNRRGFDLPAGAYFYVLTCEMNGITEQKTGHITVLREE